MEDLYLVQDSAYHLNADIILKSFEDLDPDILALYFNPDTVISFAKTDCIGYSSQVDNYTSASRLSTDVISLVGSEIGQDFVEVERKIVLLDMNIFNAANGIMVIFEGAEEKRIKINLFLNNKFKIDYITLYKSTCSYF